MKKKYLAVMLCMTAVLSLTACGGKDSNTQSTEVAQKTVTKRSGEFDIKPSELVTKLADYSGVEISVEDTYEVTDEAAQKLLTYLISGYGGDAYPEITDRDTVEETDYVKVNYTGYHNDEAFQGGAAEGVLLDIANNKTAGQEGGFIDGFTSGLAGHKVGEKVKVDVTFPEEYPNNPDLAGEPTTFEFEILGIYSTEAYTFDTISDETVKSLFEENVGITTAKDFKEVINAELEGKLNDEKAAKVKEYMAANSEVTIPEDYLQARLQEYVDSIEKENCNDTMTIEQYFESMNYTYDSAVEQIKASLESQIKVELIFGLIAEKENITADEEGLSQYVSYIMSNSNGSLADENAVYEYFGAGNADEGKAYLQNQYIVNLAVNKVADDSKVTFSSTQTEPKSLDEALESTEQ